MNALVGYTGFVGSNIYENGSFDRVFNSKNIREAYGLKPDLLIYAGLRAEKYLANHDPQKDMELIEQAQNNIYKIAPKKLVLISTIDVFKNPVGVNENTQIKVEGLHAYGYNRYHLELWTRQHYPDALIIRLPALFGKNIKKNFIYDFINRVPYMLKAEKIDELCDKIPGLQKYYELLENGFYRLRNLSEDKKSLLKKYFTESGFTALNFTDSRSRYQFYPLSRLWNDIQIALKNDIYLWHPATEPVSAGEVFFHLTGMKFCNELQSAPANYDYRTIYGNVYGKTGDYIMEKSEILDSIKEFVINQ